jgi:hypothetical protein
MATKKQHDNQANTALVNLRLAYVKSVLSLTSNFRIGSQIPLELRFVDYISVSFVCLQSHAIGLQDPQSSPHIPIPGT